jgi:hypothetical protein
MSRACPLSHRRWRRFAIPTLAASEESNAAAPFTRAQSGREIIADAMQPVIHAAERMATACTAAILDVASTSGLTGAPWDDGEGLRQDIRALLSCHLNAWLSRQLGYGRPVHAAGDTQHAPGGMQETQIRVDNRRNGLVARLSDAIGTELARDGF